MGTSASFTGLTGGGWTTAKANLTRYARSGGDREQLGRAVAAYVSAHGGASRAASSTPAGQTVMRNLGSFLSQVTTQGWAQALENEGLTHLLGQSAESVLAGLVDALAGPGSTREEAIARAAMAEVLSDLFERVLDTPEGLEALEDLDGEGIASILELFTAEFIYQKLLEEIGERIESGAATPEIAERLEEQVHDFICEMVKLEISDIDIARFDWDGPDGAALRERIFADAYRMLED